MGTRPDGFPTGVPPYPTQLFVDRALRLFLRPALLLAPIGQKLFHGHGGQQTIHSFLIASALLAELLLNKLLRQQIVPVLPIQLPQWVRFALATAGHPGAQSQPNLSLGPHRRTTSPPTCTNPIMARATRAS
jgi:hypothetical protein